MSLNIRRGLSSCFHLSRRSLYSNSGAGDRSDSGRSAPNHQHGANHQTPKRTVTQAMTWNPRLPPNVPTSVLLEGLQSSEHGAHEFAYHRELDILDRALEHCAAVGPTVHIEDDVSIQEVLEESYAQECIHVENQYGANELSDVEQQKLELYAAATPMSLYSAMQSNVPEPFSSNTRGSPTDLNMPGGGKLRQNKYLYSNVQAMHPSRQFHSKREYSTSAREEKTDQVDYERWLHNCQRYKLDCEKYLKEVEAGRKTLGEVFAEQDALIEKIVNG